MQGPRSGKEVKISLKTPQTIAVGKFFPTFVFIFEFLLAALQAPWDVDAHHDGIVYAAAVAASEGRMPNSGYFQQYGPFASTLQGGFLSLFPPTLYSLRLLTSLTVAVIGFLLFIAGRKTLGNLGAFSVSLLWTLSSPRMHGAMLPWSSFYSTILLIIAIVSIKRYSKVTLLRLNLGYLIASICIFLACLSRINALGTLLALVFVALISKNWHALKSVFLGFTIAALSFVVIALQFNFLHDYLYQCIIWAFNTYSTSGAEDMKGHIVNILMYLTIPFFGLSVLILSKFIQNRFFLALISAFLLGTLYFQNLKSSHESYANPLYLFSFISQHSHYMFSYFGIFICLFFLIKNFSSFREHKDAIAIAAIGASTLSQLFPTPDPLHLWWVAPVALIAFYNLSPKSLNVLWIRAHVSGMAKLAAILSLVMFILLVNESRIQRFPLQSTVLKGMQGTTQVDSNLDQTLILLEKVAIKNKVSFDCPDGIYAVSHEGYLPANKDFVNWSPDPEQSLWESEYIFACNSKRPSSDYLKNMNYELVFEVTTNNGYNFLAKREA